MLDRATAHRWVWSSPEAPASGAIPNALPRNATMLQLFLILFNTPLVESLRAALNTGLTARRLFEVYALRIYIQFNCVAPQRGSSDHGLYEAYKQARGAFMERNNMPLSWSTWNREFNAICMPALWARSALSAALEGMIQYGPFLVLDEKLKRYTGASPCARQVLSKPDRIGHWVSEVCVYLAENLVYCVRLFPVVTCATAGETTKVSLIVEWATMGLPRLPSGSHPTVVADAYYLDNEGRRILLETSVPFLCAINPRTISCPLHSPPQQSCRCSRQLGWFGERCHWGALHSCARSSKGIQVHHHQWQLYDMPES